MKVRLKIGNPTERYKLNKKEDRMTYEVLYKENPESRVRKHLAFCSGIKEARRIAWDFCNEKKKRVIIMKWKRGGVFTIVQIGASL